MPITRDSYGTTSWPPRAGTSPTIARTIGKPVDRGRWGMTPPTSDAYYNPLLNEIVFPAGILQPPAFGMDAVDAVNYGAIGVVIGHEISHGFDDQGAQFDAQGRLAQLVDARGPQAFTGARPVRRRSVRRLLHRAGHPPQRQARARREHRRSRAAPSIAYRAFQKAQQGKAPAPTIDGFTPEQQFFIAWGQFRGDETRPETAAPDGPGRSAPDREVSRDRTALEHARVRGGVRVQGRTRRWFARRPNAARCGDAPPPRVDIAVGCSYTVCSGGLDQSAWLSGRAASCESIGSSLKRRGMRAAALRPRVTAWFLCASLCAWGAPSRAQTTDQASRPPRMPAPDFLLKRPIGSVGVPGQLGLRAGRQRPVRFLHEQLTIDKADFRGPAVAIDVARAVTPRLDAVFGLEYGSTSMRSEDRHLVDNDFLPIEQTTALRTFHLIGEVRYAFVPRGYAVSRLAWVPRGMVLYAGAGAGAVWHEFEQSGDFVDYVDQSVFNDTFRSAGVGSYSACLRRGRVARTPAALRDGRGPVCVGRRPARLDVRGLRSD